MRTFGLIGTRGFLIFGILSTLACGGEKTQQAQSTDITYQAPPAPEVPMSRFNVPLDYDFTAVLRVVERVVPMTFGSMDDIHNIGENDSKRYAYTATRGPFRAWADGSVIRMQTTLTYAARGWFKPPIGPTISAGCGDKAQDTSAQPRITVELVTPLTLTENWHLKSEAKLARMEPASKDARDRCFVSFLGVDITDRVLDAARQGLIKHLPEIDKKVTAVDLTNRFTQWWGLLHRPIRLTDSVWLLLEPRQLRVGSVTGEQQVLTVEAGLDAYPRIITGPRPDVDTIPMPPLAKTSIDDGFYIALEGVVDYATASRAVSAALGDKSITQVGQTVHVKSVVVRPAKQGRVTLAVTFSGDVNGTLQFVGFPHYDAAQGEIRVPDLSYDLNTDSELVNTFSWLRSDALRDLFREKARVPVSQVLGRGKELLHAGLNRKIGSAVMLSAQVDSVAVKGVYVTAEGILVRAEAMGHAGMSVKQK